MTERPKSLGLKVLYDGTNPSVDIVAVHGLGATPDWAWIRKVKKDDQEVLVNWLADDDMLPAELPNSRIMTFNYESKCFLEAPKQRLYLCAIQLLTAIDNKRKKKKDTKYRPLIFIGHSFGGVVIEQSMVSANQHGGDFQYLALSTVGIIFLGTPHRGTQAARWGEIVARTGKILGLGAETSILRDLQEDSENLKDLLYEFTLWANRAPLSLVCYFELHKTNYGERFGISWKELVVDETSACIDGHRKVPLPTDHLKINKFSGPDDPSYIAVYPLIVQMAQDPSSIVDRRMNPQMIIEDNSSIKNKEILECLRALFLTNPQDDLAAIRSAKGHRVDGTCEWILTQKQYTSWLVEGSPQVLWLSGAPGIGKTMMSSFLVEELTPIAERSRQMTLAYYFCDDKYQERRTAIAILRGLLLQILRQRPFLFKHIQMSFDESRNGLFTNFHALWRIFFAIVHDPKVGELCCLVDALDECERDSRQLFLVEFTKLCSQKREGPFLKFIVTSRREIDIVESLSAVSPPIWHIQVDSGKVNDDVFKFIHARVDALSARKGYPRELENEVKNVLTNKAEGTFLYVSLVLGILEKTLAPLVRKKLRKLPEDLNKLYDKILGQIDQDYADFAVSIFRWVAVARRPLTVKEIAIACALSTSEWKTDTLSSHNFAEFEKIYECCEPLVYLDTDHDTINLVHQSAKDYLLGGYLQANESLSQYHIVLDSTNLLLFKTCWKFLSFKEFGQGTILFDRDAGHRLHRKDLDDELTTKHFFLPYAEAQWQAHAFAATPALATDSMFWNEDLVKSPILRDSLLLGAATNGEYVLVQRLLENGAQINSRDEDGSTPLLLASREGHEKVSKLLLEWLSAEIKSPHLDEQTPSCEAAEAGHTTVVKLLLSEDDIGLNSQDDDGKTPLSWAAENGHGEVVKLLLSQDNIAINSRDSSGKTPLFHAVEMRHEVVMKLLLSQDGVQVNFRNEYGHTPLLHAAEKGYEGVVKLLLSRDDIDINFRDKRGWTALKLCLMNGKKGVARLLLTQDDIEVNARDEYGETALMWAASKGHETVARLLLTREDIDVNLPDKAGWTALVWAAENGHEALVRLLLSRDDIEVNARDEDGQTALIACAMNGYEGLFRLLLTRDDIEVNARYKGQTALVWAAAEGHEAVVGLLLDRDDIEVNARDRGETALFWAAAEGHEAVVRLLLSRNDIEVNARDRGQTALVWAAAEGHEAVVRLLLSRDDIEVNARDRGQTALVWAAAKGYEAVVRLLLSRDDIDINSQDKNGLTALSYTVWPGREVVLRLLLTRDDIDVNIRDKRGRTALMVAASRIRQAMVELLLSRSDIEVTSQDLETARRWAGEYNNPCMRLLGQKFYELNEPAAQ